MKVREILEQHKFERVSSTEYIRDEWTVKLDGHEFELFADPEIDTRYYHGMIDNLELALNAI